MLYRNSDKAFDDVLSRDSATRSIGVTMALSRSSRGIVLKVDDERGNGVAVTLDMDEMQPANTPQEAARRNALGKLGGTIYVLKGLDDLLGDLFVPVSKLAELRRRAISMLDSANRIRYEVDRRRDEIPDAKFPATECSPIMIMWATTRRVTSMSSTVQKKKKKKKKVGRAGVGGGEVKARPSRCHDYALLSAQGARMLPA